MDNDKKLLIQTIQQKKDELENEELRKETKFNFIEKVIYINLEKRKDRRYCS